MLVARAGRRHPTDDRSHAIKIIDTSVDRAVVIDRFASRGARSVPIGHGSGECHVYALHFEPGGEIGPHEAGFDQLFVVAEGEGWGAGPDGVREALSTGDTMVFRRGEVHSKGSETGMRAIMIQISALEGEATGPA